MLTTAANDGTLAIFCMLEDGPIDCSAIDLSEPTPGPEQPLLTGSIPADYNSFGLDLLGQDRLLFRTVEDEQTSHHIISLADGTVGAAQEVWADDGTLPTFVAPDGSFLIAQEDDGMGGRNLLRVSIDTPDPDGAEVVAEQPMGQPAPIREVSILPGGEALIFDVEDSFLQSAEALFFAPLDGGPQASVRIDDPDLREPGELVSGPNIAPDGHAMLYYYPGASGSMAYVDLSTGTPGPSVVAWDSDKGGGRTRRFQTWWSPDSRWLVFDVDPGPGQAASLYAIDTADPDLEPTLVAGPYVADDTRALRFDPEGEWFYFSAALETENLQLYRVQMTDDGPGSPERLSNEAGLVTFEFTMTRDGSSALFTDALARGPRSLFDVELGTKRIPTLVQVNDDLPRGEAVSQGAQYSYGGEVVLFRQRPALFLDPPRLYLRDRINGDLVQVAEQGQFTTVIRELD